MDAESKLVIKMLRDALVTAAKYVPSKIIETHGRDVGFGCFEDVTLPNVDYQIVQSVLNVTKDL